MSSIALSNKYFDKYFNEIIRLSRVYHRQADKCKKSKAWLAGCIMIGAAFEAILIAFANCYIDKTIRAANAPKRKGKVEPL
ncbi:MAG: hypothetical protein ACP5P6_11000, partial [Candidatus Saccharicenans sp.]